MNQPTPIDSEEQEARWSDALISIMELVSVRSSKEDIAPIDRAHTLETIAIAVDEVAAIIRTMREKILSGL